MMRWKFKDLEPLIAHAINSVEHHLTYAQSESGQINPAPALHWVKDEGIYLMSNGSPCLPRPDGEKGSLVIYAEGFDPKEDDVWDAARDEVGGDDFVENLSIPFLFKALKEGRKYFIINCSEDQFEMKAQGTRTDKPKMPTEFIEVKLPKLDPVDKMIQEALPDCTFGV
jgi:hypothetical protein